MVKDSVSSDKGSSIIALRVLPSDTNFYVRKAILNVKSANGNTYRINISQTPYKMVYPENSLYTVSSKGGDLAVKVRANCTFRANYVWQIVGYGDSAHIRHVDWVDGDEGEWIEPKNGVATLHFHVDLNTGWGRNARLFFEGIGHDIKTWSFNIRQEPRTFQETESYAIPPLPDGYEVEVVFGNDRTNLDKIKNLSIKGLVDMGYMRYFAKFAKDHALQTLDLSNTHFDRTNRQDDTDKSVTERMFFGDKCTSIAIPSNTVYIDKEAFADCGELTHFTVPSTVTSIGDRAFAICGNLKDITIASDSKLTRIGDEAFNTGSLLNSLYIPASVIHISDRAFVGLHVKELHVAWQEVPVLTEGFITKGCTLYVPKGCAIKYKAVKFWKDCDLIIEEQ